MRQVVTVSSSLRDQLVKAGLATSKQAKKAENQSRAEQLKRQKAQKKGNPDATKGSETSPQEKARRLKADKARKDKDLARQRNDKYAQRALRAEIRQLVQAHDQRSKVTDEDAVAYNFLHGKKVKRVYVTAAQRDSLSAGRLVVINNDGNYHFVTPEIAAKIEARDPKRIIVAHQETAKEKGPDDDFYAQFEVPDDLDW